MAWIPDPGAELPPPPPMPSRLSTSFWSRTRVERGAPPGASGSSSAIFSQAAAAAFSSSESSSSPAGASVFSVGSAMIPAVLLDQHFLEQHVAHFGRLGRVGDACLQVLAQAENSGGALQVFDPQRPQIDLEAI